MEQRDERGRDGRVRAVAGRTTEELLERVQALAEALRRTATAAVGELPGPLPGAAGDLLASFRTTLSAVPAPTAPLELLAQELTAKRALVQAMQQQLASFDAQLEVLEQALVPLQEWSRQWERVQDAVLDPLRPPRSR